jgi:hypothetical protein
MAGAGDGAFSSAKTRSGAALSPVWRVRAGTCWLGIPVRRMLIASLATWSVVVPRAGHPEPVLRLLHRDVRVMVGAVVGVLLNEGLFVARERAVTNPIRAVRPGGGLRKSPTEHLPRCQAGGIVLEVEIGDRPGRAVSVEAPGPCLRGRKC